MGVMGVYCISWLVIRLFHLTSFVWMFLEGRSQIEKVCKNFFELKLPCATCFHFAGFYLFLQVQFPLSLTSVRYKHFTIIGWGEQIHHQLLHCIKCRQRQRKYEKSDSCIDICTVLSKRIQSRSSLSNQVILKDFG